MKKNKILIDKWKPGIKFIKMNKGYAVSGDGWDQISSEMGRSKGLTECPCCGNEIEFYIWSMSGGGKRCDNCNIVVYRSGVYLSEKDYNEYQKLNK